MRTLDQRLHEANGRMCLAAMNHDDAAYERALTEAAGLCDKLGVPRWEPDYTYWCNNV